MKKTHFIFTLIGCLFFMLVTREGVSQQKYNFRMQQAEGKSIVCYGKAENMHTKVPLSAETLKAMAAAHRARSTATSTIHVEYIGFEDAPQALAAFQYAVDIWESLLVSPVPIYMEARWESLQHGVLGSATTTSVFSNFDGAPRLNTWYPVVLAEKIVGEPLNEDGEADIFAAFNSNGNWYFGLDMNTPADQTDFVSVVLHELGHGLGFIGSLREVNGIGGYGYAGTDLPMVYDRFIQNGSEAFLTDPEVFVNASAFLAFEITGGDLYFSGPLAETSNSTVAPQIYAPSTYESGSSISHLDENRYPAAHKNSLMTPQIGQAEAIHDPGVGLQILHDMGWLHTYVKHKRQIDREDVENDILIQADIFSDTTFNEATVKLNYAFGNSTTFQSVVMSNVENTLFQAYIPVQVSGTSVKYFISVNESTGRTVTVPGEAPEYYYEFKLGPDTEDPEIVHTPVDFLLAREQKVNLEAIVTDNIGLEQVYIELKVNGASQGNLDLTVDEDGYTYALELVLEDNLPAKKGDKVEYRVVAIDSSLNRNTSYYPESGFHAFMVDDIGAVKQSYANDFNSQTFDFLGGNGFSIATPAGFKDGAIHSSHPYENGGGLNFESNYVFQLKYPIIVDANKPLISFREVVLVEPGEVGSQFGDQGFYDYVVVEASEDGGESWKQLLPGYDSRIKSNWLTRYNSRSEPDAENPEVPNSTATGDPSLFQYRLINIGNHFAPGKEILIRFRLFADQLAYGWGWAIDDLQIQGNIVLETEDEFETSIRAYPNPTTGKIALELNWLPGMKKVNVQVMDQLGARVMERKADLKNTGSKLTLDMSNLPSGIYYIKIDNGLTQSVQKIVLNQ